jgi:tetratricopeptide (TPR) repeat protein
MKLRLAICLLLVPLAVAAQDPQQPPPPPPENPPVDTIAPPPVPAEPQAPAAAAEPDAAPEPKRPRIPGDVAHACAVLRGGEIGRDPIGVRYLDRVESGDALAQDYAEFGVFLARRYFLGAAETMLETAVDLDKRNVEHWLNLGTVRLQFGELSASLTAYKKARKIDPNNARAHYGIAVVHDAMRNYDASVDAYVRALALDPALGDPAFNPQAANNDRLLVVKLLLYQAGEGSVGLPLEGGPPDDPRQPAPLKNGKAATAAR